MRARAERGGIVAMNPPYRYITHYKHLTDCISHQALRIDHRNSRRRRFHIDPDELLRLTQ
jgi:hypothetical protein